LFARTVPGAYVAATIFGLGFGTAYVSIAVVFGAFFGRAAFAASNGVRMMITGLLNAAAPAIAGAVADAQGTYAPAFLAVAAITLASAAAMFFTRAPQPQASPHPMASAEKA
jgi:hypothetical protein